MRIAYIQEGNILQINLTVLIVEDNQDKAFNLKAVIDEFKSQFDGGGDLWQRRMNVSYQAIINGDPNLPYQSFKGSNAVIGSMAHIKEKDIDIILCDQNLRGNLKEGNQFLADVHEYEKAYHKRIYKVLHSVLSDYQKYQDKAYVNCIYNANEAEQAKDIILSRYEASILVPKLFGNPVFHSFFYEVYGGYSFRLKDTTKLSEYSIRGVLLWQILYAYSIGDGCNEVAYVRDTYVVDTLNEYFSLKEYFLNEFFIQISDALYINRLWFADYDILNNTISFLGTTEHEHTISLASIQKGKKTTLSFTAYFNNILKKKKKPDLPTFTLDRYFKLIPKDSS